MFHKITTSTQPSVSELQEISTDNAELQDLHDQVCSYSGFRTFAQLLGVQSANTLKGVKVKVLSKDCI
jgi:hypothetical protein